MTEEEKFKLIAENLMTTKAPDNFEDTLMQKIEALNNKPLPEFKPIISNKFWVVLATLFALLFLIGKVSAINFSSEIVDNQLFSDGLNFVHNLPTELIFILTIPLFLYFVDTLRLYFFKRKLMLDKV